jgi:hypothetical protein
MRQIPIYRSTGGTNRYPWTLKFEVVAWAEADDWWHDRLETMGMWLLKTGRATNYAYLSGTRGHNGGMMHQVVCGGKDWDHADGNGLNNQESNLRKASRSDQRANQGVRRDSTTREANVSLKGRKWRVSFTKNGQVLFEHYYRDFGEAVRVATAKRREIHGDFVRA